MQNEEFLILGEALNITSKDEQEPYPERLIQTIEEKCCMYLALLPFIKLPRHLTIELVYFQIFWYNCFIPDDYIIDHMGSAEIIVGRTHDCNKMCEPGSNFGNYVQTVPFIKLYEIY